MAVATLTTLVAGVGQRSGVHLVHRAWAHDHDGQASGTVLG